MVDKSAGRSAGRAGRSADRSVRSGGWVGRSVGERAGWSTGRPVGGSRRPVGPRVGRSAGRAGRPVDGSLDGSVNRSVGQWVDRSTGRPVRSDRSVNGSAGRIRDCGSFRALDGVGDALRCDEWMPIESATLTCLSQSGKGWYFQFVMRSRVSSKCPTACCAPVRRMTAAFELRFGQELVCDKILKGGRGVKPNGAESVSLSPS